MERQPNVFWRGARYTPALTLAYLYSQTMNFYYIVLVFPVLLGAIIHHTFDIAVFGPAHLNRTVAAYRDATKRRFMALMNEPEVGYPDNYRVLIDHPEDYIQYIRKLQTSAFALATIVVVIGYAISITGLLYNFERMNFIGLLLLLGLVGTPFLTVFAKIWPAVFYFEDYRSPRETLSINQDVDEFIQLISNKDAVDNVNTAYHETRGGELEFTFTTTFESKEKLTLISEAITAGFIALVNRTDYPIATLLVDFIDGSGNRWLFKIKRDWILDFKDGESTFEDLMEKVNEVIEQKKTDGRNESADT